MTVFGPTGEKLVECTDHEYRPLEASLVTTQPGLYKLIVASLEQEPTARRYELTLEPLMKIQPSDLEDNRALKAFGEADQLWATWNESSLHEAIEKFMQAASAWRRLRPQRAIDALRSAADIHFILGGYSEALNLNRRALRESEDIGARLTEVESLSALGRIHSFLGENETARRYLAKVLARSNQSDWGNALIQEKLAAAQAQNCLGEIYYTEGNSIKAQDYFRRALELWTEVGYRRGQAQAKLNLGYTFSSSGDQQQALLFFEQAMQVYRAIDDRRGASLSLTAIGSLHSLKGNEQASLESHMQARDAFRTIGDRRSEGVTLNALGQTYEDLGDQQTALDNYVRAKQVFEKTGSVAVVSEYKIAKVYRSLGEIGKALSHYEQCIRLSRAARTRRIEAYALKDMAEIYHSQGKKQQTLRQYQQILTLYRNLGDFRGRAITLSSIGDLLSSYGEKRTALVSYTRALRLIKLAGDRDREISILYELGRLARDAGRLEDARSQIEQAIKLIETVRVAVASPDLRSSYFASVHQNYELYIEILMQLDRQRPGSGYAALALQASESARARGLIEVLLEARADLGQGIGAKLLEEQHELQEALAAKERSQMQLASSLQTQEEAAQLASEISELTARDQILEAQIRQQDPRYAAIAQPKPLALEQIQAELGDEDMLLEYALGDEKSYLWAVTKDSLKSYELPSRAIIGGLTREVYDLLTTREHVGQEPNYETQVTRSDATYTEKALALSRMLLAPVAPELWKRRLLIIPDGVLQYLPFEALPDPNADLSETVAGDRLAGNEPPFLISNHEVVNLPSISVLAAGRRHPAKVDFREKMVTIVADPVFERDDPRVRNRKGQQPEAEAGDLVGALRDFEGFGNGKDIPRLRYTLDEANAILKLVASNQGHAAIGFDADRASVLNSQIEHYQIVHFATHSLINDSQPQLSGILLSMVDRRGVPQNGFLQLRDIYNLNLSAKLVVLSACSTGLGKDVKGEGLIGLTRGFMHAGAKSVVASLWKVDDRATAELMTRFYTAMFRDNLPPAAALRVAKESLRREKRWHAPYYWAAFVLQGEYRDRVNIAPSPKGIPYKVVGLLALLICLSYGVYATKARRNLTSAN
ncbi:MAG TPA: CHAT domain-containing protein [Pyrinomonadaceae bacterium]|nr:CHAT domain-containing protein [Pyrinomonadaceae bacterium]